MTDYTNLTKEDLIKELKELKNKYNCILAKCDDDINTYKQAEVALIDIEKKFRVITENINDTIAVFDMDFNMTYISPSVKKTHGYEPEEAIKLKIDQILTPDSLNKVLKLKENIVPGVIAGAANNIFRPIELAHYQKNGNIIWTEVSFAFLMDQNNLPKGIVTVSRDISEYKQTQDALIKSEDRFRTLSSLATEGIMIHVDGIIIEANSAFANLIGYSCPDDIIGKHGFDVVVFTQETKPLVEESFRLNTTDTIDAEIINRNGEVIQVETKGIPIVYNGQDARIVKLRDISQRKIAENNLRDSISQLDASLESTADGILIVNSEGKVSKWNQKFINMWNLSDEILSKHDDAAVINLILEQLVNPNEFLEKVQYLYNNPEETSFDQIRFIDGRVFERYSQSQRIGDKIVGRVWSFRDISDRKQTEETIAMLAHAIRSISESVSITDMNDKTMFVNKAFLNTYQFEEHEIIGNNINMVRSKNNNPALVAKILPATLNGGWKGELMNIRKDGSEFPVFISTSVIRNDNGQPIALIGVAKDITERKKAEKELIKAKESAEESDRLKSSFLANMSHEIRTPMNGILGFAGLLKKPGISEEQRHEYISIIEQSGHRMLNILNDIIDISKIEAGVTKVDIQKTNINEQIEYINTFFRPEIEAKGMKLLYKKSLPERDAVINTDREKIFAILTNLVKNAIKYSYNGYIEFGYYLKYDASPAYLEFYVEDTGIGIPANRIDAIFERFIQADIVDKLALQGAGLGLAIAKAYVELLGGKIWVESIEGKGSTFHFTVPYNPIHPISEQESIASGQTVNEKVVDNLKILIAEDDDISSMLLSLEMKPFSREIIKVKSGAEAVNMCSQCDDIDLVLMDIKMPEMSGYEATRKIRESGNNVIIIAQTAFGLTGDREKAIEAGCTDYISKPINHNALMKLMQKYFG